PVIEEQTPSAAAPFPEALELTRNHLQSVIEGNDSQVQLNTVVAAFDHLQTCVELRIRPTLAPLVNAGRTLLEELDTQPQRTSVRLMSALGDLEDQRHRELAEASTPMIVAMPPAATATKPPNPTPAAPNKPVEPPKATTKPTPAAQVETAEKPAATSKPAKGSSIRVDVEKLDELMNLVGELIIAERMVTHNDDLIGKELEAFNKAALQLNRITRSLQDVAMSTRLLPVRALFRRMMRLVRDVSLKQDKQIQLELVGEEIEVDKSVIEGLADPLVHLLRNSCDHGIESPQERVAAGKPATGVVRLEARHQGGEVWIIIEDDGKGLHRDAILKKAVEKGLVQGDTTRLKDHEVFALVFQPGFSTASAVTSISGRGVGMDVVKRNVEKLRGRVEITSAPKKGTRLTLRIPLTLAIVEGMLVRTGTMLCTIPLLAIRESVSGYKQAVTTLPDGADMFRFRGQFISILDLRDFYSIQCDRPADGGTLVVVEDGERRIGLVVDELIGQRQTVIKALPGLLGRPRGLSGCSILSNGDISLILDVSTLMDQTGL
ncbi:MAG: two-component system chemotaxis sensor kinase CheA, partial [Kiritimatiellia bacterium]